MCQIYAKTDPILYESRSRSVRIHGVITGIRLENLFWQILSNMAESEAMTTNQLIVKLHGEVGEHRGEVNNFTSFLRVTCLRYQSLRAEFAVGASLVADPQSAEPQSAEPQSADSRSVYASLKLPSIRVAVKANLNDSHPLPQLVTIQGRSAQTANAQPNK
jgi:predicted DNA-binding ribbon-helix-helix protein